MRHSFLFDLRKEGLPFRIAHFPLIVRTDTVLNTGLNTGLNAGGAER